MDLNFSYNIILGDFNMPTANFNLQKAPAKIMPVIECCAKYYLRQHVKESTRPNSGSILDSVFSTIGTNVSNISIDDTLGSSDHCTIKFSVEVPSPNRQTAVTILKRNYYKADWKNSSKN